MEITVKKDGTVVLTYDLADGREIVKRDGRKTLHLNTSASDALRAKLAKK